MLSTIEWALHQKTKTPGAKLILIKLANECGRELTLQNSTELRTELSEFCNGLSYRGVLRHLKELHELGLIEYARHGSDIRVTPLTTGYLIEPEKRFKKPTVDQIEQVMFSSGLTPMESMREARQFWDYWESMGWRRKSGPMKDWQASVRTWLRNKRERDDEKNRRAFAGSRTAAAVSTEDL